MSLRNITEPGAQCRCCCRVRSEVSDMFEASGLVLCGNCITFSAGSLVEPARAAETPASAVTLPGAPSVDSRPPSEFKKLLDAHVIGQDYAKEKLAVALYEHALRINHPARQFPKGNVLLLGPTGTGKTLLAQTMARILGVPFAIGDATSFTPTGFLGQDLESMLSALFADAREDLALASRGIIYIDEFDKLAKLGSTSDGRNFGAAVQQHLLKLIEGTEAEFSVVGPAPHFQRILHRMDTSQILFVMGGAFAGLEKIIDRRLRHRGRVGFRDEGDVVDEAPGFARDTFAQVLPADLEEYGLIGELIGRLPVAASLTPLTEQDLLRVLTEPTNSLIERYRNYFEMSNHRIVFSNEALLEIARQAVELRCGARGLVTILEDVLHPLKFHAPDRTSETYSVTAEVVLRLLARGRRSSSQSAAP